MPGYWLSIRKWKTPRLWLLQTATTLTNSCLIHFQTASSYYGKKPIQADSRAHLKNLLQTAGGGIVFTTIQKFSPDGASENFELLSQRENIVVIADEAHRSQYGFAAKNGDKR